MTIYEAAKETRVHTCGKRYITQYTYQKQEDFDNAWGLVVLRPNTSDMKYAIKDDNDLTITTFSDYFNKSAYIDHNANRTIKQLMPIECERLWKIIKENIGQDSIRIDDLRSELIDIGMLLTSNGLHTYESSVDGLINVIKQAHTKLKIILDTYSKENN